MSFKYLFILIIVLYFVYRILKYYYKIKQLNFEKNKAQNTHKSKGNAIKKWEAETVDFEEIEHKK